MKTKNEHSLPRILSALFLLLIAVLILVFFYEIVEWVKITGEKYISPDHQVGEEGVAIVKAYVVYAFLTFTFLSVYLLLKLHQRLKKVVKIIIDTNKVKAVFLTDEICTKKQMPTLLLLFGTLTGIALQIYILHFGEPRQEGFMEHLSTLLLLFSVVLLLFAAILASFKPYPPHSKRKILFSILIISFALICLFGEEISWGERVIGFTPSKVFVEYNFQHELNLHNFFNPLFRYAYPAIGMSTFIILLFLWFFSNNNSYLFKLLTPPPSLLPLAFVMACASFRGHSELCEELFYTIGLFYSIRFLLCIAYPNIEKISLSKTNSSA